MVGDKIVSSDEEVFDVEYGFSDLWEKVKAAAKKLKGEIKQQVEDAIKENKPKIIDGLNNIKEVVIDAGKKVVIQVRDEIVRIIVGAETAESDVATYGIKDWWAKVKDAANKFGKDTKEIIMKQIEAMKPEILEQLEKMKKVVIDGTKKVIIEIVDDVVKIIIGDEVVSSEDELADLEFGISDIWAKVKAAADKLQGEIKQQVKEAIEKNKQAIIDGLNNVEEIVIDAGKKVVIQIRDEIVRIITGAETSETELVRAAYGFRDIWAKVKEAARKNLCVPAT